MADVSGTPPVGGRPQQPGQTPPSSSQPQPPMESQGPVPAGLQVWIKFLSMGGHQATPKEALLFTQQLMRTIGSQIQHEQERAIEAIRKLGERGDDET